MLDLCCCRRAFSSCGKQGLLFLEVCGLLIAVASHCRAQALGARASVVVACGLINKVRLVAARGPWSTQASVAEARGLSCCGTQAQ